MGGNGEEPFNAERASTALTRQGTYIAGINIFWLDFTRSATPGVPLARRRTEELGKHLFQQGPTFGKAMVTVAVPHADYDIASHLGGLLVVSPEEVPHAILHACASDGTAAWKDVLLSMTCCFQVVADGEVFITSCNLRQQVMQEHESMRRTAYQLTHELMSWKASLEEWAGKKLTPAEVATAYTAAGGKSAKNSEPITASTITAVQQVYDKIACEPALVTVIYKFEEAFGTQSCLNSLAKLQVIARAGESPNRQWILEGLQDQVLMAGTETTPMANDDITKTLLSGDRYHTGLVRLLEYKRRVLIHWLDVELPKHGFLEKDRQLIRQHMADHPTYRKMVAPGGGNLSWIGQMKPSSIDALRFLEDSLRFCHGVAHVAHPHAYRGAGVGMWGVAVSASTAMVGTCPMNGGNLPQWEPAPWWEPGLWWEPAPWWEPASRWGPCFALASTQELVYDRGQDHQLRQLAKSGGAEDLLSCQSVKDKWGVILVKLQDEKTEAAVLVGMATETDTVVEECSSPMAELHKKTANFIKNSLPYWRSIANMTLRSYVSLVAEPTTQAHLATVIQQNSTVRGELGKSCVMFLLDCDLLRESARRADRKPPVVEAHVKKLIHGGLLGRGAQKRSATEATRPSEQDVVAIHDGGRGLKQIVESPFRLVSSKSAALDVEQKTVTVVMNEDSVRARKKRVKGGDAYSAKSTIHVMSARTLVPDVVPEKPHTKYPGYNVGDVIGFVTVPPLASLWNMSRKEKVSVFGGRLVATEDGDEGSDIPAPTGIEPLFHNCTLSETFYANWYSSYSVVGVVDLSAGAGEAAKAALTARIPYVGVCMSEEHANSMEEMLTDWVLARMRQEGHTLYKADADKVDSTTAQGSASMIAQGSSPQQEDKKPKLKTPEEDKDKKSKASRKKAKRNSSSSSASEAKPKRKKAKSKNHDSSSSDSKSG